VHNAGIRHVIDLTPDAETPDFDEAVAVRTDGLAYSNLPLGGPADLTHENVQAFDAMLREAKRPVLEHCASRNRAGAIVVLRAAWMEEHAAENAIAIAKALGLKGLESEVRRRIEAAPQSRRSVPTGDEPRLGTAPQQAGQRQFERQFLLLADSGP